jgi:hypothetical protein
MYKSALEIYIQISTLLSNNGINFSPMIETGPKSIYKLAMLPSSNHAYNMHGSKSHQTRGHKHFIITTILHTLMLRLGSTVTRYHIYTELEPKDLSTYTP